MATMLAFFQMEGLQFDNEELRHETEVLRNQVRAPPPPFFTPRSCIRAIPNVLIHTKQLTVNSKDISHYLYRHNK